MPVPPQVPIIVFYSPNKRDQGLIEYWSCNNAAYVPIDIGTPHPNTRDFPGFRLGLQANLPNDESFIRRVWVSDETSPDWLNYQRKFAAENNSFPTYIRQYREDKKTYAPLTKGSVLGSVIKLVLTAAGSGYTPGTFPAVTVSGSGSGFVGHAIVNLDGTIAELVIDDQGSGYTSNPTVTVEAPPVGVTATGAAYIQEQSAYLTAEQAEEFPKDSEFFGLYFNVTRVYETLPGPTLSSTRADDDGQIVTISTTRKLCSAIVSGETLVGGVWTRTIKKQTETTMVCEEIIEIRTIPGPLQEGEQTGKWGVEPLTKQKIDLVYGSVDEGYLVRESKVDPYDGSDLVGTKVTVFYPSNVYGVNLQGQDYDPRLDAVIPWVNQLRPQAYGIGVNREDINPIDYQHAEVRTIDPAIVQAVLDAYKFIYPGRINVDMPDVLVAVYGVIDSSTSDGADQETGTSTLTGAGSISQTLTAQAQASANILPEAYPLIKQFWGNNIACQHIHFFLPNPVTLTDVLNKLNTILSPDSVSNWPKFNPELVTIVMTGGRVSVQAKAHSQGSYATSGSGTASTAAGGVGYSEERGLTIKTLRISPTIHDVINLVGDTSGTETVTSTAYAECAGLGPLETQTTGPISVYGAVTPTTIPATVGDTAWPTSGIFLYRTDPSPYRYGYIEFHCVVVDADDFPNVP